MLNLKNSFLAVSALAATGVAEAAPIAYTGVFNTYQTTVTDTQSIIPSYGMGLPVLVDPTITGFVDQAAGTWGVASTSLWFGQNWTATGGTLYTTPGSYSLDTSTHLVTSVSSCTVAFDGKMCFDIAPGQIGGTIWWAWGVSTYIPVVNVWSVDNNGNLTAVLAPQMEAGPLPPLAFAYDFQPVPLPAAAWMFGSGLLGLLGAARRKRT